MLKRVWENLLCFRDFRIFIALTVVFGFLFLRQGFKHRASLPQTHSGPSACLPNAEMLAMRRHTQLLEYPLFHRNRLRSKSLLQRVSRTTFSKHRFNAHYCQAQRVSVSSLTQGVGSGSPGSSREPTCLWLSVRTTLPQASEYYSVKWAVMALPHGFPVGPYLPPQEPYRR